MFNSQIYGLQIMDKKHFRPRLRSLSRAINELTEWGLRVSVLYQTYYFDNKPSFNTLF